MMNKLRLSVSIICLLSILDVKAQERMEGALSAFPELIFTNILGAPKLSMPQLLVGTEQPIVAEGMGLASPAFYDWDGDGVKDLLVGEFFSGAENGRVVGSFVRVYKNIGTYELPKFTGQWEYATPPFLFLTDGTPYSVLQGCCMGFAPQFPDLNQDGFPDMISGQYTGDVSWFKGSQDGFLQRESLQQVGASGEAFNTKQDYWAFSSASFGDLNGDGLLDMVTGGGSLRVSFNIGTISEPKFSERDTLLDMNDEPIKVHDWTESENKDWRDFAKNFPSGVVTQAIAGNEKISPLVFDWDNDGVNDLLTVNSYTTDNLFAVQFFKGFNTKRGIRFQKPIPLFTSKNGEKPFPGSGPKIFICDWNMDGIFDLLIGASVATMNGKVNDRLSWNWEHDTGIYAAGKDPGNFAATTQDKKALQGQKDYYSKHLPSGISIDDYMTIRHVGYVYVMLGKK